MSRLIIAILNPGHSFSNLKEAQNELSPAVSGLLPKGCKNVPAPFMTDGDDLGEKDVILQTEELIIEEVLNEDGQALRRLVLKNNISAIQSQYKMTYFSAKNRPELIDQNTQSILAPKKNMVIGIDESYLDNESHKAMIAGLSLLDQEVFNKPELNVLVLGGGLCAMSRFIYTHVPNAKITTVEISKGVVEAVKNMFPDIKDNNRFKLINDNALSYVKNLPVNLHPKVQPSVPTVPVLKKEGVEEEEVKAESESKDSFNSTEEKQPNSKAQQQQQQQFKLHKQFDIIIIDILNSQEDATSPPEQFLSQVFLAKLQQLLVCESGLLMINYIGMEAKQCQQFIDSQLQSQFDEIYTYKSSSSNGLTDVIYIVNTIFKRDAIIDSMNQAQTRIIVNQEQIKNKKQLETNFKQVMKKLTKPWDFTLNIEAMCSNIVLRYPLINAGAFQRTNVFVDNGGEQLINNTKQMYENDLGKVVKKEKKKSKNKKK